MLKIRNIILESLFNEDSEENGVLEFTYNNMLTNQAEDDFLKLKDELEKEGITTVVNYPNVSKITIITSKAKAQTARDLAEIKGFRFQKELFDMKWHFSVFV